MPGIIKAWVAEQEKIIADIEAKAAPMRRGITFKTKPDSSLLGGDRTDAAAGKVP